MTEVIAHRGASRVERGNTVAAFERAVELGSDGIELDVRRTADGLLVVHHDAVLGDGRVIVETPRSELPFYLPSLAEALDACAGAWVNLEIKNDPGEPDFDPDDAVVGGSLPSSSGAARADRGWCRRSGWRPSTAAAPSPPTCPRRGSSSRSGSTRRRCSPNAAMPRCIPWVDTVTEDVIARCHAAGLAVNTWTCNDPAWARELAAWGIDGICTDVPGVLLDALR